MPRVRWCCRCPWRPECWGSNPRAGKALSVGGSVMPLDRLPALPELAPRWRGGTIEFPLHHMRGGTSTGLVIWERYVPPDRELREELLRHLMGLPLQGERRGNRQITGL